MKMYPDVAIRKKEYPLQSILFGHRIQPSQTKYEYLIEFFQVAIAKKRSGNGPNGTTSFVIEEMFPIVQAANGQFEYSPQLRIGLKRFIFLPKSKLDGKAEVDKVAYRECVKALEKQMVGGNALTKENSIYVIQNLLCGFSAVNQSRSWFDQNVLPICPEVILPEGMGVKSKRQTMEFDVNNTAVDEEFDYHKYTYMCRGGEVYYLHLLNAVAEHPEYKSLIESRLHEMITSFPQFSYLCNFIQNTWETYYTASKDVKSEVKKLGAIPAVFSQRNGQTLSELSNFLNSKSHPFEKMETFANGIILQIMRMMYVAASTDQESNCWVIDANCSGYENVEAKKRAISAFRHNEEVISTYLYQNLPQYRYLLDDKKDDQTIIKDAANDSYRLFRKLGKMIGVIIPNSGKGMRFSLSEDIIKFLVLSIIPPKQMVTLDEFVDLLYQHFGMVIGPDQYQIEMDRGSVSNVGDLSFLKSNLQAFAQKLKDCGFLRDLSDATSIVENPYEQEDSNE
ncbi:hypothetical protein [Anaeromassilibacillus senegalensis]|uniref:hypothetical protein n=1 Tax=Anaeromassilibacillus senegalensis TaxID=1673717 RepID=UPI0006819CF4|nr:hypothetical protein [Anaeromassilibacillus senegalensis]